jgi:glycosyltransferase involved in cell wall biosynthesis
MSPHRERVTPDAVTVVVPVYNEAQGLPQTLKAIKAAMEGWGGQWELLVVDDGSTDGSHEVVEAFGGARLVRHCRNRGVGAARKTGVREARYDAIAMLDGDATYPANQLPHLLELLSDNDMVVGARTGQNVHRSLLRHPAKWVIRKLASFISGHHIPDLNSGMRAFWKRHALAFESILPDGHSWVATITLALLANGHAVAFHPIDYYRREGRSSFHPIRDTCNYVVLVLRTMTYFDPLKVFLPSGLFFLVAGVVKLVMDDVLYNDVKESDIMLIIVGFLIVFLGLLADLVVKQHKIYGSWPRRDSSR